MEFDHRQATRQMKKKTFFSLHFFLLFLTIVEASNNTRPDSHLAESHIKAETAKKKTIFYSKAFNIRADVSETIVMGVYGSNAFLVFERRNKNFVFYAGSASFFFFKISI
jgi:hypothetical protein